MIAGSINIVLLNILCVLWLCLLREGEAMARNGKPKDRPSRRKDMEDKGRKGTSKPIPDTFENVIKALVKPVRKGKPTGAEDSS